MDPEVLAAVSQFGAAGLIGWMWLSERRASGDRERRLSEAHDKLVSRGEEIEVLVGVVRENARALEALESSQRGLVRLLEREARSRTAPSRGAGSVDSGGDR